MPRGSPVDGFELAYDRSGSGRAVVLLHGWPGDRSDYRKVVPLLEGFADVIVPDFRGFGESDKHDHLPADAYSAAAQARSIVGLIDELGLRQPILAGYDIGSRVAQAIAKSNPDIVKSLVISPPLPGVCDRVFTIEAQREFWYQAFHQLQLARELVDGQREAVRSYLRHFWSHWSGPAFTLSEAELDHLVDVYSAPGAFVASIGWYRASAGIVALSAVEHPPAPKDRVTTPTTVLWPEHDPLFPQHWSDRISEFFTTFEVRSIDAVGHFTPLEAPSIFAGAIAEFCR